MVLAHSERYTRHQPVVLTTDFLVGFPLFGNSDLEVYVDGVEQETYTVQSTYVGGVSNDATVVLPAAVTGVDVEIYGARDPQRGGNYLGNNPDLANNLQLDADKLTAVQQEQQRDYKRSLKTSARSPDAGPLVATEAERADRLIKFSEGGDSLELGPTAEQVSNAQQNAVAASASASAAAESAALAATFIPANYPQKNGNEEITGNWTVSGSLDLTGVNDKPGIRQALGLEIGANVQAYSPALGLVSGTNTGDEEPATETEAGIVEKSTSAENVAGTEADKFPDVPGVKEMIEAHAGGWAKLAEATASNTAMIDFTAFDSTKYDDYLFAIRNLIPVTDNSLFEMLFSINGGGAFKNAPGDYRHTICVSSPIGTSGKGSTSAAELLFCDTFGVSNTAGEGVSGEIIVFTPHVATSRTQVTSRTSHISAAGARYLHISTSAGEVLNAEVNNAVRFLFSAGNIASGTITMYGRRKS